MAVFVGSAVAKPVPHHPTGEAHGLTERHHPSGEVHEKRNLLSSTVSPISLNKWNGLEVLNGFDNFFGLGNFDGSRNLQNVFLNQQNVCQAQQLNVVQQQLFILQESAKQILLQNICDLQAQAILFEQFKGGFDVFGQDLLRLNGRVPGFDQDIAGKLGQLLLDDGKFNNIDFGFNGFDIGKKLVVPGINVNNGLIGNDLQGFLDAQGAARAAKDVTDILRLSKQEFKFL